LSVLLFSCCFLCCTWNWGKGRWKGSKGINVFSSLSLKKNEHSKYVKINQRQIILQSWRKSHSFSTSAYRTISILISTFLFLARYGAYILLVIYVSVSRDQTKCFWLSRGRIVGFIKILFNTWSDEDTDIIFKYKFDIDQTGTKTTLIRTV
jgi:hypothetical protein